MGAPTGEFWYFFGGGVFRDLECVCAPEHAESAIALGWQGFTGVTQQVAKDLAEVVLNPQPNPTP